MTTYSVFLAWRIPWTEEPDGLQLMGSQEWDTTEQLTLPIFFQPECIQNSYNSKIKMKRQ